jgi:hypothetical protein
MEKAKNRVLYVTPTLGKKQACGVGLYGKLWSDALQELPDCEFKVLYTDSLQETYETIEQFSPDVVFYMYHLGITMWMADPILRNTFTKAKHVAILYDIQQHEVDNFNPEASTGGIPYAIVANPTLQGTNRVVIVNKLLPPSPTLEYKEPQIPIVGFQGFAAYYKGVARLAHTINREFDECVFKLHMPPAYYFDQNGEHINQRINEVRSIITKPGIQVEFSHHMMDTQELVNWLSQNTINCYLYDYEHPAGLASAPDYALAAKRPIAVSNNMMLKNFRSCVPSVILDEPYTLKQIIQNGIEPLKGLHQDYSKESFLQDWRRAIDHFLSN